MTAEIWQKKTEKEKSIMKTEELIKTLPLEVMRDLTTEKRKEIIQSLEEPKIYGSEKYTHQELAIHQCFLVDQAEDAFEEAEKKCDKKRTEIEETQKALDLAKAEYEKAAQKMNAIQEELDKKRAELEEAESDRKAKEDAFVKEETLAKEMKTIVVVHSSATFEQLKGHMHSVISITGSDKDVLDILKPQNVFGKPKAYKWLKNIPESLKKIPDGEKKTGLFDYCEMVLDTMDIKKSNKDLNVIALYNDEVIAEVLKANGLSES
jgi:Tat protein secretion system quality control protein TatD with DNase activity